MNRVNKAPKESTVELDPCTKLSFSTELSLVTHLSYRLGDARAVDYSAEIDGITFNYFTDCVPLGAGFYGQVKKAVLQSTGQVVVIKNLHPPIRSAESFFQSELGNKTLLESEYAAFAEAYPQEYATCHYNQSQNTLVIPFVRGRGLIEIHSLAQYFDVYSQLTEQVIQLHEKGITHGDFDGGNNIIVSPQGVKLIDFGYAVVHNDTKEQEEEKFFPSFQEGTAFIEEGADKQAEKRSECFHKKPFDARTKRQLIKFFKNNKESSIFLDFQKKELFLDNVQRYISNEKKKTSPDDIRQSLHGIFIKITYQNFSTEKLKSIDCSFLADYFDFLHSKIEKKVNPIPENTEFTNLKKSLKKVLGDYKEPEKSIGSNLREQKMAVAKSQIDKFKMELQGTVNDHLNSLLFSEKSIEITNLIHQKNSFMNLLDLLPLQDRLNILDEYYKELSGKNVEEEKLRDIAAMYFFEYRYLTELIDTNERNKLIEHAIKNHNIPKQYSNYFSEETRKHSEFITQEIIKNFIDKPDANTLDIFLRNCHRFYHDRDQLKKQVRQAMVILSHLFSTDSDQKCQEESNGNSSEKALLDLKKSVFEREDENAKDLRNAVLQTFLWIKKAINFNDLKDVKTRLRYFIDNPKFAEFKGKFSKETATDLEADKDQQAEFRAKAIEMIQERIGAINSSALFFTNNKAITDRKMQYLDAVLAHIELIKFASLDRFLKPKFLKIHYPSLFQTRQPSFLFWEKKNNPQSTKTYKMFEELSDSYNKVLTQTKPLC